ncbi:MAG: hypothetical protein L6Q81_07340 [Bacteroidia bacterium]|nr:hypothetical protein [Bacteroidia bacterium]
MVSGEEVTQWLKIVEVALISSVKFLFAPFEAERQGMGFAQAFGVTTTGGAVGILVFYYAGSAIAAWWSNNVAKVKSFFTRRPITDFTGENKRVMTRTNKRVVWIKQKFGLVGIAFVTPCLISIPIGTLVAVAFYRKRKPVILYLMISLLLWSLTLNFIAQWLQLSQYMPEALQHHG